MKLTCRNISVQQISFLSFKESQIRLATFSAERILSGKLLSRKFSQLCTLDFWLAPFFQSANCNFSPQKVKRVSRQENKTDSFRQITRIFILSFKGLVCSVSH